MHGSNRATYTGCIKTVGSLFFDNYSEIPRSIALADMENVVHYKLPTADFLQHTQVFMKPVLEPRE